MDNNKEFIVLYINKEDKCFHQVLLNDIETNKIAEEIRKMFMAKKSPVLVNEAKLRIVKEVRVDEQEENSRKVQ